MRYVTITILLFFVYSECFAQRDAENVKFASEAFNKALIAKDSNTLKKILHPQLSYGHSNAWIETKQELIDDLFNGTITYNKVTTEKIEVMMITKKLATVRADVMIDADFESYKGLVFHLHVLQTWKWQNMMGWQLVNRQSVSIPEK